MRRHTCACSSSFRCRRQFQRPTLWQTFRRCACPSTADAGTGAYSERMKSMRKYVFSSTLERADWNNSVIIRGNVADAVARLKQEDGQDLVFYGHGPLGQTLLDHHLLDELRLCIHPLLVGSGKLLFHHR